MEKDLLELAKAYQQTRDPNVDNRLTEYIQGGYVEFDRQGEWDIVRPGREDDIVLVTDETGPLPIAKSEEG